MVNREPYVGIMDVMVMDQSTAPVKFFINNLNEDTFFFKTLVSNGVCPEWCDDSRWPERFPSPKPYGVSQPGTVVKFIVTDTGGVNRIRCGGQLYQSSYQSLQLPYAFIGLGRTFSYIVQFSVGISAGRRARPFDHVRPQRAEGHRQATLAPGRP